MLCLDYQKARCELSSYTHNCAQKQLIGKVRIQAGAAGGLLLSQAAQHEADEMLAKKKTDLAQGKENSALRMDVIRMKADKAGVSRLKLQRIPFPLAVQGAGHFL